MTFDRWIGVHTGGTHYLDHLGILCQGLGLTLFVTERETYEVAKEFYPGLDVKYIDLVDLSLHFLAERADVIFESGHTFATELLPLWELLLGKKMRVVYCPHGNSDKKSPKLTKDISLIYGDHMKNHLEKTGESTLLDKMIVTGNYRASHYYAHKRWYDDKLTNFLKGRLDPTKKTVFYAPTWEGDGFFERSLKVIQEVGSQFNLLIRLHPFIEDLYPAENEKIKTLGGIDLSNFPSIYPILNLSDCYLGDFSSIGYDFLTMDKPLFFLDRNDGEIYECGITLSGHEHYGDAIAFFQGDNGFGEKRRWLAQRVFGGRKSFDAIKNELKEALSSDRASWIMT